MGSAAVVPTVLPPKPANTPYERPKTAKQHARQVAIDLPKGGVLDHIHKRPVTSSLSTRDLHQYSKKSKTQQRIMDELVTLGVVEKRPGRAASIAAKYRHIPEPKVPGIVSSGEVYVRKVDAG